MLKLIHPNHVLSSAQLEINTFQVEANKGPVASRLMDDPEGCSCTLLHSNPSAFLWARDSVGRIVGAEGFYVVST